MSRLQPRWATEEPAGHDSARHIRDLTISGDLSATLPASRDRFGRDDSGLWVGPLPELAPATVIPTPPALNQPVRCSGSSGTGSPGRTYA